MSGVATYIMKNGFEELRENPTEAVSSGIDTQRIQDKGFESSFLDSTVY